MFSAKEQNFNTSPLSLSMLTRHEEHILSPETLYLHASGGRIAQGVVFVQFIYMFLSGVSVCVVSLPIASKKEKEERDKRCLSRDQLWRSTDSVEEWQLFVGMSCRRSIWKIEGLSLLENSSKKMIENERGSTGRGFLAWCMR